MLSLETRLRIRSCNEDILTLIGFTIAAFESCRARSSGTPSLSNLSIVAKQERENMASLTSSLSPHFVFIN
jgi:hypothetical protein